MTQNSTCDQIPALYENLKNRSLNVRLYQAVLEQLVAVAGAHNLTRFVLQYTVKYSSKNPVKSIITFSRTAMFTVLDYSSDF